VGCRSHRDDRHSRPARRESFRVTHHGYWIGYARSVRQLEKWVELADLKEALIPVVCLPRSMSGCGRYQIDGHPSVLHQTVRCPGPLGPSARAGAQSHGDQPTITRPGPHGCPCWQCVGYAHQSGRHTPRTGTLEHTLDSRYWSSC